MKDLIEYIVKSIVQRPSKVQVKKIPGEGFTSIEINADQKDLGLIIGKNGKIIKAYTERNAYRMPAYHRLDISITYTMKRGHTWNFSLYNAYGRKNAYAILIEGEDSRPEKLSLFSFVPSLSFNYIF